MIQTQPLDEAPAVPLPDRGPDPARLTICTLAACPFPANHGTPGSIREMAEALADQGHDVHVVTYHFGEDIPVRGPTLHRITPLTRESSVVVGPTSRRPLYDLQMVFKTLQVIRRHRPDVLHAHGYEAALVAWLCRMATGVPVLYSGHNTMSDELASYRFIRPKWLANALARLLDAWVPRIGDRCLPHSPNMEAFFQTRGLGPRTEPVVPFGIDLDEVPCGDGRAVRRRLGLDGSKVVVYAGLMDEFQRLDLLLEGMALVVRQEPRAKLLMITSIVHEAQKADLLRRAEALGLADHLVLTDPQPLDAMRETLTAGDVAVVPRPQTPGFPIKLINYMAAGRACVLFASSANGLTDGEDARLVAPDSGEALGRAILGLLGDDESRRRLARGALQFVRERHDRRVTARLIGEAYHRTLAARGRSPALTARPLVPCPVPAPGALN
jgi:glycosyltransferase involved in cell wall biosynthesis